MKENFFKKLLFGTAIASTLASCEQNHLPEHEQVVKDTNEQQIEDSVFLESAPADLLDKAAETVVYGATESGDHRLSQEIISGQKDWTLSYIRSEGYRKRLIGEMAVQLGLSEGDPLVVNQAEKLIRSRLAAVMQVKIYEDGLNEDGGYYPKSEDTREVQDGKPLVLELSEHGAVKLGKGFQFKYPNQVVHELSHASTDTKDFGDGQIDSTERRQVEHSQPDIEGDFRTSIDAGVSYGYANAPTEDKAHIGAFRYLLNCAHVYDSNSGAEFTIEHLKKALEHPEIIQDVDVHTLFKTTPTIKDLLWKMNHVA